MNWLRRIPLGAHELITTDPSGCTWTDYDGSLWVHMNWLRQIPLGAHELITTDPSRCTWTDYDGTLSVHMNLLPFCYLQTFLMTGTAAVLMTRTSLQTRNCSCIDDKNKFTNPEPQLYWWQEQVYKLGTTAVMMTRTSLQTRNCSCIDDKNKFTNPELQLYWWQEQVYKQNIM
jgi:hypothetical protein